MRGLLPLVVGLVVWQFASTNGPSAYFPPPSQWWEALMQLWQAGQLQPAIVTTVSSFIASLVIASVIGASLGIVLGRVPRADRVMGPAFEFARTMPAGAVVPVAVLVMGYAQSMTMAVVVFVSIWPVLLSTRAGVKQLPVERLETARVMRLSRGATFRKVVLPSSASSIMLGVQIAAPLALIITLVVEVITQSSGLGRQLGLAQGGFRYAAVYGLVAITGLIGLLVNLIVGGPIAHMFRRYEA